MLLVKWHLKYLFSKQNIIIMIVILSVVTIAFLIFANPFTNKTINQIDEILNYQNSVIIIVKLVIILFSSFLFGNSFTRNHDNYCLLYVRDNNTRIAYFLSKILLLIITILIIISILYIEYLLIGYFNYTAFTFNISILDIYLKIYLLSITYGMISIICVLIIPTVWSVIIPYILYVISEMSSEIINQDIVYLIDLFIPTLHNNETTYILSYKTIYLIILILIYLVISIIKYIRKDL